MIPQDPVMLLSFINLKLRDFYGSLKNANDDMLIGKVKFHDTVNGAN